MAHRKRRQWRVCLHRHGHVRFRSSRLPSRRRRIRSQRLRRHRGERNGRGPCAVGTLLRRSAQLRRKRQCLVRPTLFGRQRRPKSVPQLRSVPEWFDRNRRRSSRLRSRRCPRLRRRSRPRTRASSESEGRALAEVRNEQVDSQPRSACSVKLLRVMRSPTWSGGAPLSTQQPSHARS